MWRAKQLLRDSGWQALILAGVALIGVETLQLGGVDGPTAITFSGLLAVWAAAVIAVMAPPPSVLLRRGMVAAAVLACLLAAWIVLTLTPAVPAWVAPSWSGVKGPGAMTSDRAATLRELVKLGGLVCVFVAGLSIGWRRKQVRFFLRALAVGAALYAMWAIASFVLEPSLLLGKAKAYHVDRLTASFASANTAGSLFGALSALFAMLAAEEGINQLKSAPTFGERGMGGPTPTLLLWAWTSLVCLGALLLTASRFGMVATAAGLALGACLMSVIAGLRARTAALIGAGALALVATLPMITAAGAARRAWNLGDTVYDRLDATSALLGMAAERPWQGYGLGAFRDAIAPGMNRENLRLLWDLGAAHNLVVQWLLETGVVGVVLAAGVLAALVSLLWPLPLKRGLPGRGRLIAVLAFTVVVLLHNMVDYSLQIVSVATVWALLLGLGASAAYGGEHKGELA